MFRRILLLVLLTFVAGTAANLLSPRKIPWVQDWSNLVERKAIEEGLHVLDLDATRLAMQTGSHMIFDARKLEEYDQGHIPTAMSLPEREFDEAFSMYQTLLTPDQAILVYCSGEECDESLQLGMLLRDVGFTNIAIFVGGMAEWSQTEEVE